MLEESLNIRKQKTVNLYHNDRELKYEETATEIHTILTDILLSKSVTSADTKSWPRVFTLTFKIKIIEMRMSIVYIFYYQLAS